MRTSAAPGCCVIWSGLHQRVIGEAIDHVRRVDGWAHVWELMDETSYTCWDNMNVIDSYLMWQFDFYVETSYLTL